MTTTDSHTVLTMRSPTERRRRTTGALGTVVVPANGTVRVTVTFIVPDAVADPNANRGVAVR